MPIKKYPGYRYDKKSRRYRSQETGSITPVRAIERSLALKANTPDNESDYGFSFSLNRSPESEIYASMERIVGLGEHGNVDIVNDPTLKRAGKRYNDLIALMDQDDMTGAEPYTHRVRTIDDDGRSNWVQSDVIGEPAQQQPPQPIPTGIRSAMSLAEYYCNTQGDVWQHIEAPIDLSISELKISVPKDRAVEKMLKDLYGPEQLDMKHVVFQNMLISSVFGSAYPMEVPDNSDNPSVIRQIVQLPPKYMWVGYHMVNGMLLPEGLPSPYAMRPWDGAPNWTQDLARKTFMPMTYNAFASGFNEQIIQGWGLPVNPRYLHPMRTKAWDWIRYPLPPISRAFRSISTRAIYQEMRRALLEGYKNQLWLFILGTKEMPPSPNEMAALRNMVNGMTGERTGNLVWRFGLDVKVVAPAALQDAIGSEVSQQFALEIFRDLGSSVRLVSGNKISMPGGGAGDAGIEIDLSVWLRRLNFLREANMDWEYLFRMRQADRWDGATGHAARKALETAKVSFSKPLLEIEEKIKKVILPLYSVGLTSPQTALSEAEEDYDTELANKDDFEPNRDKFLAPPTYNQTATNMGGGKTESATTPQGRPADVLNPNKLRAAWGDSQKLAVFMAALEESLQALWNSSDVDAFIADLKAKNVKYLDQIGLEAYQALGGVGTPNLETLRIASNYVNSYADNFGSDLKAMLESGEPIGTDSVKRRALMYAQEGYKSAVVNLQNRAMAERGASHWRRVLHPELSKDGPCPLCIADSSVIHGMQEPFSVMHPGDVCGTQEINLQYFIGGIPSIEVPVPNSGNEMAQAIFGTAASGKTRRKRVKK